MYKYSIWHGLSGRPRIKCPGLKNTSVICGCCKRMQKLTSIVYIYIYIYIQYTYTGIIIGFCQRFLYAWGPVKAQVQMWGLGLIGAQGPGAESL